MIWKVPSIFFITINEQRVTIHILPNFDLLTNGYLNPLSLLVVIAIGADPYLRAFNYIIEGKKKKGGSGC